MKVTNNLTNRQNKQLSFMSKTTVMSQKGYEFANQFIKNTSGKPQASSFISLAAPAGGVLDVIMTKITFSGNHNLLGTFFVLCGEILREAALFNHKTAIKNAHKLGQELKHTEFLSKEKQKIIKYYLRKDGNIIFSNLFNLMCNKRIAKLAEGEPVKDLFLSLCSNTSRYVKANQGGFWQ